VPKNLRVRSDRITPKGGRRKRKSPAIAERNPRKKMKRNQELKEKTSNRQVAAEKEKKKKTEKQGRRGDKG